MKLTEKRLAQIEQNLKNKSIGLIGDFCLDIYWNADMTRSEISRETPHFPLPVVQERMYLGAAGNVAANIAALNPEKLYAMSLYGDDWRGMLMLEQLKKANIDTEFFLKVKNRFTNAYCKPMRKGISNLVYEDARLDFDNYEPISAEVEDAVLDRLKSLTACVDVLCVADQFKFGIITERVRDAIIKLAASGLPVIADSRYNIAEYSDCIVKPNEVECWKAVYADNGYLNASEDEFTEAADKLARQKGLTVFCTLGANGSYITDGKNGIPVKAKKLTGDIDICGAGDTSLSAFTCAVAAGCGYEEAAVLAGTASAVTVKKIGVTGTASFDEIREKLD